MYKGTKIGSSLSFPYKVSKVLETTVWEWWGISNSLTGIKYQELVPISRHLHQHMLGYTNQAQHKPPARVKTNTLKKTPLVWGLAPDYFQSTCHHWIDKFVSWYQHKKTQFFHFIYTEQGSSLFTSAAIMEVQMGEITEVGWLIRWSIRDMWVNFFLFPACGAWFNLQGLRFFPTYSVAFLICMLD
jgi:hypothetical protein